MCGLRIKDKRPSSMHLRSCTNRPGVGGRNRTCPAAPAPPTPSPAIGLAQSKRRDFFNYSESGTSGASSGSSTDSTSGSSTGAKSKDATVAAPSSLQSPAGTSPTSVTPSMRIGATGWLTVVPSLRMRRWSYSASKSSAITSTVKDLASAPSSDLSSAVA